MNNMNFKKILSILLLIISLNGCTTLFIGAATTIGLKTGLDERSVSTIAYDSIIWAKIKKILLQERDIVFSQIKIKVNDGNVLILGHVRDSEIRLRMSQKIWEVEGVKRITNELNTKEQSPSYIEDSWITAQIKMRFLAKLTKINFVSYEIDTENSIVYIFGIAKDYKELLLVQDTVARVYGVTKVISYVRVKSY